MVNTLRRKMFKLGGEVSKSHGVGITSGLSYNKGGRVGFEPGGSVPGVLIDKLKKKPKTAIPAYLAEKLIPLANKFNPFRARGMFGSEGPIRSPVKYTMGDPSKIATNPILRFGGRSLRGAQTAGLYGTPFAVYSTLAGRMTPEERAEATDLRKAIDTGLGVAEVGTDFAFPLATAAGVAADTLLESATDDPSYLDAFTLPDLYRKYIGDGLPEEEPTINLEGTGAGVKDLKPQDIAERIAELNKQRIESDIEMYRSIMGQGDNTDKLATIGSALTQGGAALLSGEGYGAAASAFNQPLEAARLTREEREQLVTSGAAEYALGNYATERALEDATLAELIKTGDLATAEQVQRYTLANKLSGGYVPVLPESTKDLGVLDTDQLTGGTVYQNPKGLTTAEGTPIRGLFVATNKNKTDAAGFDSLEKAQEFAASE